jgi:hypothetical protein
MERNQTPTSVRTRAFYRQVLSVLKAARIPYLVAGGYALRHHVCMRRNTKDLDLFVYPRDVERTLFCLAEAGFSTEFTHPHWLGKAFDGTDFVDIIFSSGNGVCTVDEQFFLHATPGRLFGIDVEWSPVEEIIWSKAFIMERERFDGADVAHLLRAGSDRLDFQRLLDRFDHHWRVLLAHLILFGFIYPSEQTRIPAWLQENLMARLCHETTSCPRSAPVCGGTLLSRAQFLSDLHEWGYLDARITAGVMDETQVRAWTKAMRSESSQP